jgi:hypothetical protein
MTKEGLQLDELNKILEKWIKTFQLDDWKIDIEITDFKRKDFKQSGDIKIDLENKTARLLMTDKPFRNEESTIVHELTHLLLWKFDMFSEKVILKNCEEHTGDHLQYLNELEETVARLTDIFLTSSEANFIKLADN